MSAMWVRLLSGEFNLACEVKKQIGKRLLENCEMHVDSQFGAKSKIFCCVVLRLCFNIYNSSTVESSRNNYLQSSKAEA